MRAPPGQHGDILDTVLPESLTSPLDRLSPREIQVLKLVVEGRTSKEIARLLGVLPTTVDTYRSRIMAKLDVSDVPALVRLAIRYRLIDL
jgi:DNA-binding CsgD family transcriptional regulator